MASRQCGCECDASEHHAGCTCNRTYHTQTVAHQCASSHVRHNLISDRFNMNMPSSSTCACPPRVQCEEGREQTRAQRYLQGSINKHIPSVREYILHVQRNASKHCSVTFSVTLATRVPFRSARMPDPACTRHHPHTTLVPASRARGCVGCLRAGCHSMTCT